MKKILRLLVAVIACVTIVTACSDDNTEPQPNTKPNPEPDDSEQVANTWVFNNGKVVKVGSVLILESADKVNVFFSAKEGLTTVREFNEVEDCSEISFPLSDVGSEINLVDISEDDALTYFKSALPGFGEKYGFKISASDKTISEGTLTASLENDEMTVTCEFITLDNTKFKVILCSPVQQVEVPDGSQGSSCEYEVKSSDISYTGVFRSSFYLKNTWDEGWTFTYSVSGMNNYIQLGSNTFVEIYVGSQQLLSGEPFDVATTDYPFSFRIEYFDSAVGLVPVSIDNDNRAGASGTITFKPNNSGLYDMYYDLTLNSGDITLKGFYVGEMQPRNMIFSGGQGDLGMIRSATLDTSSSPCVLYLSTQSGTAGRNQYDIRCEISKNEFRYDWFFGFSFADCSVKWVDGVVYDYYKCKEESSAFFGGNWMVSNLKTIPGGGYVGECKITLYGSKTSFAYYCGEIKLTK
ncbi:MAG: hypothetical protein K2M94_06930 [Paramuribaculum sp.]|nr:hypothetical protein [Paramuribaculum sp.]